MQTKAEPVIPFQSPAQRSKLPRLATSSPWSSQLACNPCSCFRTSTQMNTQVVQRVRVFGQTPPGGERTVPLSLLDATTARFALTNAIWIFERPTAAHAKELNIAEHFRHCLAITLNSYPQWCGQHGAIDNINGRAPSEGVSFPPHSRRFGRVYAHFGTPDDPGVELLTATSSATSEEIYDPSRTETQPLWNRDQDRLQDFVPPTEIAKALESNDADSAGLRKPLMAIQLTELACGGLILAAKISHPMADIGALAHFVQDWAAVSRAVLAGDEFPRLNPSFEPKRLDSLAAGDIDHDEMDPTIANQVKQLPLHRYDWWASPAKPPEAFDGQGVDSELGLKPMPWAEWDTKARISHYTLHLSHEQADFLWQKVAKEGQDDTRRISKHDAILAHVWGCIVRARNLEQDQGPVHCDLVLGSRPVLQLGSSFIGSPTMMLNIEMPAAEVAASSKSSRGLGVVAGQIRETVSTMSNPSNFADFLHCLAFEKSPQRIWQGFLGTRHIMVTSWVRSGIYDIDFGLGSRVRFADGLVGHYDGLLLITEGPPGPESGTSAKGWTENGVDVSLHLRAEDMERLVKDPLLVPILS